MRDGEQLEIERSSWENLDTKMTEITIYSPDASLEAFNWTNQDTIQLNIDSGYDISSIALSTEALAEFCFSCIKEFDLIGILEKRIEGGI